MGRKFKKKWGYYEVLGKGPGWKVKRLVLEPGKATSPHYHDHRTEQWAVVAGAARVFTYLPEDGEDVSDLFYPVSYGEPIDPGAIHQLGNETDALLEVIEVQTGEICEEWDRKRMRVKFAGAMPWK